MVSGVRLGKSGVILVLFVFSCVWGVSVLPPVKNEIKSSIFGEVLVEVVWVDFLCVGVRVYFLSIAGH